MLSFLVIKAVICGKAFLAIHVIGTQESCGLSDRLQLIL